MDLNSTEFKSISCSKIPDSFLNDKPSVIAHFNKFGKVTRFILKPKRSELTVEYESTEDAQNALENGGNFRGFAFDIAPTHQTQEKKMNEDYIDPDVQSELESMASTSMTSMSRPGMDFYKKPNAPIVKSIKKLSESKPRGIVDPKLILFAKEELEGLIKKPAVTSEEKFQVLDARDKYYRAVLGKNTDIKKAQSTKGTCKDMCPEKERYMRDARFQVSSFEENANNSSINHKIAIKQYSRSSADQEVPLPHDLRPEEVLRTTMSYLLHNVIDLLDNPQITISDWFHFVWDRTRSIRKDITQQELCSPGTVKLVEQCVRFHIHCSARLIAEDPSVFDQKINTENLTKSLQTLKYMYDDLRQKGIRCENEAEFRGYVILLNLNDGNFIWEIKQLEKQVLDSYEIRFALNIYFSIANNNYVRFFRLVKETTYMNACILLRYFNQMRLKAINIILRSHAPRRGSFRYSIAHLTDSLGFEDNVATMTYLSYHNLRYDLEGINVIMDSNDFQYPETPFLMERALNVVESKISTTVAEAICGAPLPSPDSFLNHIPHSSFDDDGFLKNESFTAGDQNMDNITSKDVVFKIPKVSPPVSPAASMMNRMKPTNILQKSSLDKRDSSNHSPPKFRSSVFSSPQPIKENIFNMKATGNFAPIGKSNEFIFGGPQSRSITSDTSESSSNGIFSIGTQQGKDQTLKNEESKKSIFGGFSFNADNSKSSFFGSTVQSNISTETSSTNTFGSTINQSNKSPLFGSMTPQSSIFKSFRMTTNSAFDSGSNISDQTKQREENKFKEMKRLEEEAHLKEIEKKQIEEMKKLEEERKIKEAQQRKKQEEEEQRLKLMAMINEKAKSELENVLSDILNEEIEKESKRSIDFLVELPKEIYLELENTLIEDELYHLYRQEFLSYVNRMKNKYSLLLKCFKAWQWSVSNNVKRRELLSNIDCWIPNKSIEEKADQLQHPGQRKSLSDMKQYLKGSPQDITVPDMDKTDKIDLFKHQMTFDNVKYLNNIYWKVIISTPNQNQEDCISFATFINKWLLKTLSNSIELGSSIFYINERLMPKQRRKVGICIRKICGSQLLNESKEICKKEIENINGILFMATAKKLTCSRKRLQNILDKLNYSVPVTIMIYKNYYKESDEKEIGNVFDLSTEVHVSNFEIVFYYEVHEKDQNLKEVTIDCFQFLYNSFVNQILHPNFKLFNMEMLQTVEFFEICLGNDMLKRIEESCNQNYHFRNQMTNFNLTIELCNSMIDKLIELLTEDCQKMPSIPPEFRKIVSVQNFHVPLTYEYFPNDWKSNERRRVLKDFAQKLKLTKMPDDNFKSFDDLKSKLMSFLKINLELNSDRCFHRVIDSVLKVLYQNEFENENDVNDFIKKFNWLSVIDEIVLTKFNNVYKKEMSYGKLPKKVIYNKLIFAQYRDIPWWYAVKFKSTPKKSCDERPSKKQKFDFAIDFGMGSLDDIVAETHKTINKLDMQLESYKEMRTTTRDIGKDFESYLNRYEERVKDLKKQWSSADL